MVNERELKHISSADLKILIHDLNSRLPGDHSINVDNIPDNAMISRMEAENYIQAQTGLPRLDITTDSEGTNIIVNRENNHVIAAENGDAYQSPHPSRTRNTDW